MKLGDIKYKRSIIIINKNFQFKFSILLMVPILTIQILFWLAIEIFFQNMIKRGEAYNLPVGHNYFNLLVLQKNELMFIFLGISILVAIIIFIWGLYISHKIAGPFYKLEKYLDEANSLNDVMNTKLEFRKNDFFLNIPKSFNQFINRVSKHEIE